MQLLTQFGLDQGLSLEICLQGTGLDCSLLADPGAEVDAEQELQLIRNLVVGCNAKPGLGLYMGHNYRLNNYGIWGFALLSSPTFREAVHLGIRYLGLTYAFHDVHQVEHDDEVHLLLVPREMPEELQAFVLERDLSGMLQVQRELLGESSSLLRVELTLPEPDDPSPYTKEIGVLPLFGQRDNRFVFPRHLLDLPLTGANPQAMQACEKQCLLLLAKRNQRGGLAGQIRNLLLECPGRMPDMAQAAARLHLSTRTLRRHLEAEGSNFRLLLEEVRQTLAEELLAIGVLTLEEISERLGYGEVSNFIHAFKRWKGMAPRQFQHHRLKSR
ncbi:AraC family transcriptional regulator [Pseudomonas fluorescens]|uniref:AraC family transcriptional regulator n=1 Tax=Pseudomonas fluorescens TaxID=294 RepID=UPI001CD78610|nr:AraC family transcriptional regulator [Pseudomonas fluorescens]